MKYRILVVLHDDFSAYGGISEFNRNLINSITNLGHSIKIINCRKNKFINIISFLRSFFMMATGNYDYLFIDHIGLSYFSLPGLIRRRPVFVQTHGSEILSKKYQYFRWLLRRTNILTVSKATQKSILENFGLDSRIIHNIYDRNTFKYKDREIARKNLGIPLNKIVLSTVARLDSRRCGYKGHRLVIDEISNSNDKESIMYLIVGKGDDYESLMKYSEEKGIAVEFYTASSSSEVSEILSASDIHVLLSKYEGYGIVHLEAMACGCPTCGLAFGGAVEALEKSSLNFVLDERNLQLIETAKIARNYNKSDRKGIAENIALSVNVGNLQNEVNKNMFNE